MNKKLFNKNSILERLSINLLNEALDALKFSVEFLEHNQSFKDEKKLKLAVIQLHRFIEYIFKYIVSEYNPLLVFSNVFKEKIKLEKSHTISLEEAINFYINSISFGLINTEKQHEANELQRKIKTLIKYRNKINHWVVENYELEGIEIHLSSVLQIIYLITLDHNLHDKIFGSLPKKQKKFLEKYITEEWRKLHTALKEADLYRSHSGDPKEYDPSSTPIFGCPNCGNETFILSNNSNNFFCTYCKYREKSGNCHLQISCNGESIPESYLSIWNDDDIEAASAMACDDCLDEFDARLDKD